MTDNEKSVTLAGIIVGPHGVEVHPGFWEDLKNAPEDIQREAKRLIENMRVAARLAFEKHGDNVDEQHFLVELEKLTGQSSEPLTAEDCKIVEEIEKRYGDFPTKH